MGAFSSFFGTGWNDVPKQRSTRRATAKRSAPRKIVTGANTGIDTGRNPAGNENLAREEDLAKHAELARALVLKSWTGIVQGLIKKAKTGGYQQTKLLLDLCELTKDGSELSGQHKEQLCDALLEGLGLSSAERRERACNSEDSGAPGNMPASEEISSIAAPWCAEGGGPAGDIESAGFLDPAAPRSE